MLKITWFGHAAFLLESPELSVIIDPYKYPDAGGYEPIDASADAVVISHINDRYHSHTGQIRPGFELLKAFEFPPEGVSYRGVDFRSIPVYETPEKLAGDEVTVIRFLMGGLEVVYLGDLGHSLSDEEYAALGKPDVVFASTGGKPTITLEELVPMIDRLSPRWVIPMHFKTPKVNLNIFPNEAFLELVREKYDIRKLEASKVELPWGNPGQRPEVIVLEHLR
jgi:L-ascorbate metabolism protein UlaG (beta-lactamase superfamily)